MQFFIALPLISTLFILTSAASTLTASQLNILQQTVSDYANQLNQDIADTTQFFEAYPSLSGSALISQASAAETALQSAIGNAGSVISELSNGVNIPMAQVVKGELIDNDFLLEISLQFQDIADGMILYLLNPSPFLIYKSRLID
jgi:flagellar hook protein FlgE